MAQTDIGTSGWSYGDSSEQGGWVGSFYPTKTIKKLPYYSQYFATVEFDSIYYEKFYSKMGMGTFEGMISATPDKFQFSVKVPETITRKNKLGENAMALFNEFLERVEPLNHSNKLGAILLQMSPNFRVSDFRNAERFLDKLPKGYDYALEFRHPTWQTEGSLELLKHYNIASVMTDSPAPDLAFLSEPIVTADHAFIRLHGRNDGFWYNYLYSKQELIPWADKVDQIEKQVAKIRVYFNNHYGGNAVLNALQFKELTSTLNDKEKDALSRVEAYITGKGGLEKWMG